MGDESGPHRDEPRNFLWTFLKVLLSLVLGLAALGALGATLCGVIVGFFGPGTGSWSIALAGAISLALLVYALIWIWR